MVLDSVYNIIYIIFSILFSPHSHCIPILCLAENSSPLNSVVCRNCPYYTIFKQSQISYQIVDISHDIGLYSHSHMAHIGDIPMNTPIDRWFPISSSPFSNAR